MIFVNWSSSIKELRTKMQLSQEELAKELGISFASVNRYENGKFEPTIKVKMKSKFYQINMVLITSIQTMYLQIAQRD